MRQAFEDAARLAGNDDVAPKPEIPPELVVKSSAMQPGPASGRALQPDADARHRARSKYSKNMSANFGTEVTRY
jgi:hypothetical protein